MSKIADLIRRVTRIEPGPIGFGAGPRKRPPTMALVALVGERWPQHTREAIEAGADAVILSSRPGDRDLKEAAGAAGGHACGLRMSGGELDLAKVREAGVDFLVLDLASPASALLDEELGFVMHVSGELSDAQLRALEPSPIDAVSLEHDVDVATVAGLLELRRVVGLARRALLAQVRADAQQGDLLALRQAGVALVGVDTNDRGAIEAIKRLRGVIDELPAPPKRKREEAEIRLPTAASRAVAPADDDDEEDEEDDE